MINLYTAGYSVALEYACSLLKTAGCPFTDVPKDATHLLLPVPSFDQDGNIKGGGSLSELLNALPGDATVLGGLLERPELENYHRIDLLKDPAYVAENANITAHCALTLAMNGLQCTLEQCPVLVVGWGRIGKCLARLLQRLNADVTVAARKAADRAMLTALGYRAVDTVGLSPEKYRVIFNTAPQMVLPNCSRSTLNIDLASKPGLGGENILWARGLPNKDAPESSGALIAKTVLRLISDQEVTK